MTRVQDSRSRPRQLRLGAWVSNQRSRAATQSPERMEQLSAIGMRCPPCPAHVETTDTQRVRLCAPAYAPSCGRRQQSVCAHRPVGICSAQPALQGLAVASAMPGPPLHRAPSEDHLHRYVRATHVNELQAQDAS
ncbi:helicase associated domain-containing protein [Streptomyces sp. NPDC048197]|uniref:helicase associated domain-containing protein n=1 Tax=Streptomyces sp. NPDC048197 TaxID=3365511 RepID=UPI00371F3793